MITKLLKFSLVFICLYVLFSTTLGSAFFIRGKGKIYDSVIRLHVLANSNSNEDQELKLKVRDKIVALTSSMFRDCKDIDSARAIANQNKDILLEAATHTVRQNGYNYDVDIQMNTEAYPVRYYGDFVFPAGEYFSVRIGIGKAEGKNWWCVLFPPMCSSSYVNSTEEDMKLLQDYGFDEELTNSLLNNKPKTKIKFRLFDLFRRK